MLLAAVGCVVSAPAADGPRLVLRAPDLAHPLTETAPAPSRPEDPVKRGVWERVNADRAAAGLAPVAWDEASSRVADAFCADQVREGTRAHFLMNGVPPYARTGLAGIFGVDAENSVAWTSTGASFPKSPLELALAGQAEMMAEKPPNDGHRRTILDPDATHVGIGWAQGGGRFRMAQEFLTRHLAFLTLELAARDPTTLLFQGQVMRGERLMFVTFANEPSPKKLTRSQVNARSQYSHPDARLAYAPEDMTTLHVVGAETLPLVRMGSDGGFSFRFTPSAPGLWTILIYTAPDHGKPRPGGAAVLWLEKTPS